jgi:hypothetical protein
MRWWVRYDMISKTVLLVFIMMMALVVLNLAKMTFAKRAQSQKQISIKGSAQDRLKNTDGHIEDFRRPDDTVVPDYTPVIAEGSTQRLDFLQMDFSENESYIRERDVFDVSAQIIREINEP